MGCQNRTCSRKPGRRIDPNGTATRAEVATIIHRLALSIAVSGADPMN